MLDLKKNLLIKDPETSLPPSKSNVQTQHQEISKLLAVFLYQLWRQTMTCLPEITTWKLCKEEFLAASMKTKILPPEVHYIGNFMEKTENISSKCKNFSGLYSMGWVRSQGHTWRFYAYLILIERPSYFYRIYIILNPC